MKKGIRYFSITIVILALVSITIPGYAAEGDSKNVKQLDNNRGSNFDNFIHLGYYGSLYSQAAQFSHGWGALMGARAACLIDNIFAIGAGFGISLHTKNGFPGLQNRNHRSMNRLNITRTRLLYGGGYISYHIFSEKLIHFSLGSLLGWGHVGRDHAGGPGSRFFIVEPEVYLWINIPKYTRIGIGTSYRFTFGANYNGLKDQDFRGFSISLAVLAGYL